MPDGGDIKAGNRTIKFLEFNSWDFIGWPCRYIDAICKGGKICA
jgi:hypothetical protein